MPPASGTGIGLTLVRPAPTLKKPSLRAWHHAGKARMRLSANTESLVGALLVGGGLLLLLLRLFGRDDLLWPFFIIVPGLALAGAAIFSGWRSKQMASAGLVIAGIGLILLVQAIFDYHRSWAYAWTLLPLAGGAGLLLYGWQHGDEAAVEKGRNIVQWSAAAFVVLAAAFELLFFDNRYIGTGLVLPIVLIVIGGFLLMRRRGEHSGQAERDEGL